MNPGRLGQRITLQGLQTTRDAGGGVLESYVVKKNCWAHFKIIRAYGDMLANKDTNVCLFEVTIRDDRCAATAPHRGDLVLCSGRTFSVESVSLPSRGYVSMTCREES